jgi:signal transduction histidine kinase/PAS domain-containing protein
MIQNQPGKPVRIPKSGASGRSQTKPAKNERTDAASETLLKAILDSLPAHIAVLSDDGRIMAVNEPWLRFAQNNGAPDAKKVGVGANYFDVCKSACEKDNPHAVAAVAGLKSVLAGKQPRFSMEYPCDAPGCPRWFRMEVLRSVGNVGGAIVAHTEITERKMAQQLLAWEKSALELIVGAKPLHEILDQLMLDLEAQTPGAVCSVLLLDEDGVHLRHGGAPSLPEAYNRAISGLAIGPAVGSCGTAAFEKRQVIVSNIATDSLWADYRELALGHELRACWSTPILSGSGKILGTFAVYYRDVRQPSVFEMEMIERATHVVSIAIERARAEENIRKFHAELEKRVEERTLELQAANSELEAFSYSVSHDLRAPLRAMDGFSRMVLEDHAGKLDENGRRMLGVIHSEAERMGRLIDELLAFSRLGRQQIESVWIDMETMARETFQELASGNPGRRLKLVLHPLPPARGAEAMIRQVWVNLISNAVKFTKNRECGEIEIGAKTSEGGECTYYVKDNGAGFDMRHADKLFGIFQRLHSQQDFPGTGVGLALVQRIVQRHGGRIQAEAGIDQGATFYFTLPASES